MSKYGMQIKEDNFNQLFINAIYWIYTEGQWTNPRDFNCKEIIASQLILTNPKKCLCTIKNRKLNYAYLIIEKMMYITQTQYPQILIAYNKNMQNFINEDTGFFDGAYGDRIAKNKQLDYCYNSLKNNKDSRQAVIIIHDFLDKRKSKDIVCTLSLQFLIRNNKLDMITTMRSNDLLWGTCLDIPAFCFVQEILAHWLNIDIGIYIHQPASLHYYKEFENKLLNLLQLEKQSNIRVENHNEINNKSIPNWDVPYDELNDALIEFWYKERLIRMNLTKPLQTKWSSINYYLQELFNYWKSKCEYQKNN